MQFSPTAPRTSSKSLQTQQIQSQVATSPSTPADEADPSINPLAPKQSEASPNIVTKSPKTRSPFRFPVRRRLNFKQSLEKMHNTLSSSFSLRRANRDCSISKNYDADAENSESSPGAPNMGSRDDLIRVRSERDINYSGLMENNPTI